jgi:hypothetical protein|nr:MAG TPA: ESAT-6 LIKE PROTEIN ESXB, 6, CFP-10, ESAT-6, HELIX-TURN-HELIX, FOUR [Caudoviricetes sp.]
MNKWLRNDLMKISEQVEELSSDIERIRDGEEEKLDNIPESLQDSNKAEVFQEVIDFLDDALASMTEACEAITNAVGV